MHFDLQFRRLWGIDLKFETLAYYLTNNLYNKYHYSAMHFAWIMAPFWIRIVPLRDILINNF